MDEYFERLVKITVMTKKCSERSNDLLIQELKKATKEAVEFLKSKRLQLISLKSKIQTT